MPDSKRGKNDIVEGEILGETGSETVMNLPPIPDEDDTRGDDPLSVPPIYQEDDEAAPDTGRRFLLTRILLGSTAALALGGSAALILNRRRQDDQTVVILPNQQDPVIGPEADEIGNLARQIAELQDQLEALTLERDTLLTDLEAANAQIATLQAQCAAAEEVNGLWARMDDIGIDGLLTIALGVVGLPLGAVSRVAAVLAVGLQVAQAAVDNFVAALPTPSAGITWLTDQVTRTRAALADLADDLQEAVDPNNNVTTMVSSFIIWLLDRLPFNSGQSARAGLESMQNIVNSLPTLADGIADDVLAHISGWFSDDDERSFAGVLISPIVVEVFKPAQDIVEKVADLEEKYNAQLREPVMNAIDERDAIRAEISSAQARLDNLKVTQVA